MYHQGLKVFLHIENLIYEAKDYRTQITREKFVVYMYV